MTSTHFDPIQVEVWRHLLESVAEEMGATLERTGYSPNIKERRDHSCALFDADGRLLSQAAHIPVHLGAMPLMMERLLHTVRWAPGIMWLCNDPSHGGTHLPDLTLVAPVFPPNAQRPAPKAPIGFVANRAHHADIGGLSPGSLPLSTELFHEGLIIPPVRLVVRNRVQPDIVAVVCANSRTGRERRGDLAAQVAANQIGIRRMQELVQRAGRPEFEKRTEEARLYAEAVVRAVLRNAREGEYTFEDYLDDDGAGKSDLVIRVTATIGNGSIRFDFTGTAPETAGSVNCTEAVTRSACYYVVRCLVDEQIPANAGAFTPVHVVAPEGTLVNARFPRAVAAGNVETSQRIVDALLGALAEAFPERIPAASQGTMNNVTIGGWDPERGQRFAYYETICGGAGAGKGQAGAHAVHVHMTNTRNTPIEALEMHYPLRVRRYALRQGSGGKGEYAGGDGVIREMELLAPAHLSLLTERRKRGPYGAQGGEPGEVGRNTLQSENGTETELPPKWTGIAEAGSVVRIETPGGGGYGTEDTS
jgi:N-methylhydantoinase B/oxoprolinase/acetone carboxylase alpha subunit